MPQVTLNTEALEHAFQQGLEIRPLLHRIGTFVVSEFMQRIQQQRIGDKPMEARGSSDQDYANIAGIIRYLQRGQGSPNIPSRYFERRPALVDTGRLRNSITYNIKGGTKIEVGPTVKYAKKQILGESETFPGAGKGGDRTVREGLKRYLKRNKDKRKALGWLFSRDEVEIKPKARNFIEPTDDLQRDIQGIIETFLQERVEG